MTDPEPTELLRHRLESPARETPDCLDDATLAAVAEGSLAAAARGAALRHVATCARCRGIVGSVARSLADPTVARQVAALEGGAARRWWVIGLPAAAAAIVLVLALPRWVDDVSGRHRGPPEGGTQQPRPLAPVGTVARAANLQWSSVAHADRYRVVLFDAGGRVLYETQVADTAAALPDTVRLVPGQSYLWKVEARVRPDRWAESDLVRFSVAGAAQR